MELISGNIFIRPSIMSYKGLSIDGHTHNFDHTTIVFRGAVNVIVTKPDGTIIVKDFVAPSHFLVEADAKHQITALEDDTEFWCVYSHRTPQGDITQVATGFTEGYK